MIKSMTGYGRGEAQGAGKRITVELKAVNHRYSEVVVRLPRNYVSLEEPMKKLVLDQVSRGRVDVFVNFEEDGEVKPTVKVDKGLAGAYHQSLKELAHELELPWDLGIAQMVTFPEVIKVEQPEEDMEAIEQAVKQAVSQAVQALMAMRREEGETLAQDLRNRLDTLLRMVDAVERRAPMVVEEYRQKLGERISELMDKIPVDEQRLAQEVAHFADRASITEEIVRFRSHVEQFRQTLVQQDSVGRKLDFLVQEMNREVNTMGSKANDLEITRNVVDAKSELEKVREQVQNIE